MDEFDLDDLLSDIQAVTNESQSDFDKLEKELKGGEKTRKVEEEYTIGEDPMNMKFEEEEVKLEIKPEGKSELEKLESETSHFDLESLLKKPEEVPPPIPPFVPPEEYEVSSQSALKIKVVNPVVVPSEEELDFFVEEEQNAEQVNMPNKAELKPIKQSVAIPIVNRSERKKEESAVNPLDVQIETPSYEKPVPRGLNPQLPPIDLNVGIEDATSANVKVTQDWKISVSI